MVAGAILCADRADAQQAWGDLSISRPAQPPVKKPKRAPVPIIDDQSEDSSTDWAAATSKTATAITPSASRQDVSVGHAQDAADRAEQTDSDPNIDGRVDDKVSTFIEDVQGFAASDPRLPIDKAAFLTPPAGYDALAFQIELDPQTDPRPSRLTSLEPFTPVGRRAGSWVVFPTVELGAASTSNVYKSSNAKPDLVFDARSTLLAVTDWQQHALQFKVTGAGSAYTRFTTEDDKSYGLEARARFDITHRSNIEVLVAHTLEQEPRSSIGAPADAKTPTPYVTDKVAVAFNQRFNRLSVQLRGTATDVDYHPVDTTAGDILSNDERDLSIREAAFRAAWAFSPALSVFAETGVNNQRYRTLPADGLSRDSTGDRFKLGLSFGTQSQIWRGEVAAGYGRQNARNPLLQDAKGLIFEANLGWKPTKITAVLFKAGTDFTTSTDVGQGYAIERSIGVEVRQALQHRLVAIAGLSYQVTDYQGIALLERTTKADLGLEYAFSQSTSLLARYEHSLKGSTNADGGSKTDTVRLAVRYRP